MRRFIKVTLLGIGILLIIAQLIPRHWNTTSAPQPNDISRVYSVPPNVTALLKNSCYDCHSNNTTYPWYANVQPVNWWLTDHVNEGKKELNFSEFAGYTAKRQRKKFNEIMDEVKEGKMPLKSYTWMHGNAKLTEAQKNALYKWCEESIATLPPAEPSQQSDNNKSTPQ